MTNDIIKLIEYRFSQAEETIIAAKELFANKHYKDAVNRAYYAMFYCTLGLLAGKNLGSSKHSGVLSLFSRNFVKTGMFPTNSGRYLRQAYELRQRCDYREFVDIEREQVEEVLGNGNATKFIDEARRVLGEMHGRD